MAEAARHLSLDEDREVTRQLVLTWHMDGLRTVGDALDRLEAMEPGQRRQMLDAARSACSLPSTAEIDAQRRAAAPLALPVAPLSPSTELVQHEDGTWSERALRPLRLAPAPSGGFIDLDEQAGSNAREEAVADSDRRQRQSRADDATTDAEEMRRLEAERRAQLQRELPDHLKGTAA